MLLESSPILSVPILASSCGLTSGGMVAGSNATLCGPPLTTTNLIASPCFMVTLAGSKRYPLASPTMLTVLVAPVAGAIATAPPAVPPAGGGEGGAGVVVGVGAGVVSVATCVGSAGFLFPPSPAPGGRQPTATLK